MVIRRQLTLFVEPAAAVELERARRAWNPAQAALIRAHVTLAREDELADEARVVATLAAGALPALTLGFGPPERFDAGRGVLLPARAGLAAYAALRRQVLAGAVAEVRQAAPHLTLIHPRNGTCTDASFADLTARALPTELTFAMVELIEQRAGGPWRSLARFPLARPPR
ncbi:MAG: 2'-5' RNA ligase family protein [Kofleriaceae bacterium]